jgi:hypothetical protein
MRYPVALLLVVSAGAQTMQEGKVAAFGKEFVYHYSPAEPNSPVAVILDAKPDRWPVPAEWMKLVPQVDALTDIGVKVVELMLADAAKRTNVNWNRVYLLGEAQFVTFAVSRIPDICAAAASVGGDAKLAIATNKIYTANSQLVPKLDAKSEKEAIDFVGKQETMPMQPKVDCETGNQAFTRCYYLQITKFDPRMINQALGTTRVNPGPLVRLAIGQFGYTPDIEVTKAMGPLKTGDRIIAFNGKEVNDHNEYERLLARMNEDQAVTLTVQRGKQRQRIETSAKVAQRDEPLSGRIRGEYSVESKELLVISRAVAEFAIQLPRPWSGATINWNGVEVSKNTAAGCWLVSISGIAACK